MNERPEHGEWPGCTHDQYHADPAVGRSVLGVFRQSRRRYHGLYVAKTLKEKEPSAAMQLGTLVHRATLQPDLYAKYVVAPKVDRRKKADKEKWAEFVAEHPDPSLYIDKEQKQLAEAMRDAFLASPIVRPLLDRAGPVERVIVWKDPKTGISCKAMFDKLCEPMGAGGPVVLDLKTSHNASPEAFVRSAVNLGYHRQLAWYLDGHLAVYKRDDVRMAFGVVDSRPPHEVTLYELDKRAINLGRQQNEAALADMARCLETDDWMNPWEKAPKMLALPPWAANEGMWEVHGE